MTLIKILKAQAFNAAILVLEDESTDKGSRTEDDHGSVLRGAVDWRQSNGPSAGGRLNTFRSITHIGVWPWNGLQESLGQQGSG